MTVQQAASAGNANGLAIRARMVRIRSVRRLISKKIYKRPDILITGGGTRIGPLQGTAIC